MIPPNVTPYPAAARRDNYDGPGAQWCCDWCGEEVAADAVTYLPPAHSRSRWICAACAETACPHCGDVSPDGVTLCCPAGPDPRAMWDLRLALVGRARR